MLYFWILYGMYLSAGLGILITTVVAMSLCEEKLRLVAALELVMFWPIHVYITYRHGRDAKRKFLTDMEEES